MASRKVEVSIVGDARSLERAFGRAGKSAGAFDKSVSKLGAVGMGILAGATAGATMAIGRGLVNAMRDGISEFQAQAKVSAQTAAALKSTGMAAGVTQKHIEQMSSALQDQTGLADDAVQGAQNLLLTFTKISNAGPDKIFDRATRATADLSVALGKDLNGSALMVGKALNDPVKGVTALGRAGVQFTKSQKDTIKSLVETGRVADAQKLILKELETQVGGSAKAFGESTPGQLAKAQRAYEDMTESIASALVPALASLLPLVTKAMTSIAPIVQKAAQAFADLIVQISKSEQFQQLAAAVKDLATQGIAILSAALKVLLPLVIAIAAPLAAFAAGVLNSQAALVALAAAASAFVAVKLARHVQESADAMRNLAVVRGAVTGFQTLAQIVGVLGGNFKGVSAQAVGLAPGLTAAQGGVSRIATAGKLAGSAMKSFGSAAMAAAGGPWVVGLAVGAAAVTTLATVIGGDLVSSFRGAGSAMDQLTDSLNGFTQAQLATQSAQGTFMTAMLSYTDAVNAEAKARDKVAEATRAADSARATYGAKSPQAIAAAQVEADANRGLSGAIAQVESTRTGAASGLGNYITALRNSGKAVGDVTTKLVGAVAPMGLVDTKTKEGAAAWKRHKDAVDLAYAAVGKTGQFKAAQDGLQKLADYLKGLPPKYAGVAKEAQRVADMKPGPAQQQAYDNLIGKLEKMAGKIAGVPEVKVKADGAQAQRVFDTLKRKLDKLQDKTITVTVNEVNTSGGGGKGKSKNTREGGVERWVTTLGDNLGKAFSQIRDQMASAASGLASMFGQAKRSMYGGQKGFAYSGDSLFAGRATTGFGGDASLNEKVKALSDRQALRQEKALLANITRLQGDATASQEDKDAAQDDLKDFYAQRDIDRMQQGIDAQVASDEKAVTSLAARFKKGEISAATFQTELQKLVGGDTGATLGTMFGDEWVSAFDAVLEPLRTKIWEKLGLSNVIGPGLSDAGPAVSSAADADWLAARKQFIKRYNALKKGKGGLTAADKASLRKDYGAVTLGEWDKIHQRPLASGGIVMSPTNALIGEAGREAVIPLEGPRARRMLRGANGVAGGQVTMVFNGVLNAKDAARMLRPELDRLVRLAV